MTKRAKVIQISPKPEPVRKSESYWLCAGCNDKISIPSGLTADELVDMTRSHMEVCEPTQLAKAANQ
jgi:hypothetical protein